MEHTPHMAESIERRGILNCASLTRAAGTLRALSRPFTCATPFAVPLPDKAGGGGRIAWFHRVCVPLSFVNCCTRSEEGKTNSTMHGTRPVEGASTAKKPPLEEENSHPLPVKSWAFLFRSIPILPKPKSVATQGPQPARIGLDAALPSSRGH